MTQVLAQKNAYIYLDHNATSPVRPGVRALMDDIFSQGFNASASHAMGKQARRLVSESRHTLLSAIHAEDAHLVFTSGGTESNNFILSQGWDHIFCSATEHASVYNYPHVQLIPVHETGLLNLSDLEAKLKVTQGQRVLVSVHGANNETGILQNLRDVARLAHQYGALCHGDCVQMLGKTSLSFRDLGIDFLTISGHKMGAPQGIGALVMKKDYALTPVFHGGFQEGRMRPGTESVALIAGFAEAVRQIDLKHMSLLEKALRTLETDLITRCQTQGMSFFVIGQHQERLPQTSCMGLLGSDAQLQLMYLDLKNIGVSIGSACASGVVKPSHVLTNMGLSQKITGAALRVSLGWNTVCEDVDLFKEIWTSSWGRQKDEMRTVQNEKKAYLS